MQPQIECRHHNFPLPTGDAESPYSVLAIVRAAQLGEVDALTAAAEESWILSRLFQQLLAFVHNSTGTPWYGHSTVPCSRGVQGLHLN